MNRLMRMIWVGAILVVLGGVSWWLFRLSTTDRRTESAIGSPAASGVSVNDILSGTLGRKILADGTELVFLQGKGWIPPELALYFVLDAQSGAISNREDLDSFLAGVSSLGFDLIAKGDRRGTTLVQFACDRYFLMHQHEAAVVHWSRLEKEGITKSDRMMGSAMRGHNLERLGRTLEAERAYLRVISPESPPDVAPGGADQDMYLSYATAARGLRGIRLARGDKLGALQANMLVADTSSISALQSNPGVQSAFVEAVWMANDVGMYDQALRLADRLLAEVPGYGVGDGNRLALLGHRARAASSGGENTHIYANELSALWQDAAFREVPQRLDIGYDLAMAYFQSNQSLEALRTASDVLIEIERLKPRLSDTERKKFADPDTVASLMLVRAMALGELDDRSEMEATLRQIIDRFPDTNEARIAEQNLDPMEHFTPK